MASKRQIFVGGVPIGGGAPVAVQTMTKTETANLEATMEQIVKVADAGADLVRVAVPRDRDAVALKTIVERSPIPVIADIHFNYTLALKAIDAGAHCIRLNPGNIGGREKVAEVAVRATEAGVPMRIVEVILLVFYAIPAWAKRVRAFPSENETVVVRVVGEQFAWNVHYPGADGRSAGPTSSWFPPTTRSASIARDPQAKDDITDDQPVDGAGQPPGARSPVEQGRHPQLRVV